MKHFEVYELVDQQTFEQLGDEALRVFSPDALQALDDLREYFDVPLMVNNWHVGGKLQWRGWRIPQKAAELGAPHSAHALGQAFDVDIQGIRADVARYHIMLDKDHSLLQRIMRLEDAVNWVHFDVMPVPDRIRLFKS